MNAAKIHAALAYVHLAERTSSHPYGMARVDAARHAVEHHALTDDERDTLLRALNVTLSEISR